MPPKQNTDLEDIKEMFNEINTKFDGIVKETKEIAEKLSTIDIEHIPSHVKAIRIAIVMQMNLIYFCGICQMICYCKCDRSHAALYAATINHSACPSYNLYVQLLWL